MAEILVIDDQDRLTSLLRRALPEHELLGPARSGEAAFSAIERRRPELALLDVDFRIPEAELLGWRAGLEAGAVERLRRTQGLLILRAIRARWPDLPVLVTTHADDLSLEDRGELAGEEYTYLLSHDALDASALRAQIGSVLEARASAEADGPIYWGGRLPMRALRQRLAILARGRLPVTLLGPTGTGKSLIARHFIHPHSGRSGRFVSLDLSTVPRDLMASQLFGAARGAYTGAIADRPGAFEVADGGTLFLDEVGNLSEEAQKMLLAVLQEGVVTRVGDLRERPVDVKLVVATHEDLAARARSGSFRADLLMRLNPAAAVTLPSLAERVADLPALIAHSIQMALARPYLATLLDDYRQRAGLLRARVEVALGGRVPERRPGRLVFYLPDRSARMLRARDWPGNLRELAMVLENAALFILTEALAAAPGERADILQLRPKVLRDLLGGEPAAPADDAGPQPGEGLGVRVQLRPHEALHQVAADCERQYFTQLYLDARGDFGRMAEQLLGDAEQARKVQLRFNQLGLRARALKERLD